MLRHPPAPDGRETVVPRSPDRMPDSDPSRHTPVASQPVGSPQEADAADGPDEVADEALMQRVQASDDLDAFEQLFRRYEYRIFGYYARLLRDKAIAEDYTQDVFTKLWSSRENYKPTGRFASFVFQIARNHYINQNTRCTNRPDDAPIEAALGSPPDVHRDDRPVETLLRREIQEAIEQALSELPDEQREVFVLSRFEKLKYQEIADLMGTPVRTVESRLVLATKKLMVKLHAFQTSPPDDSDNAAGEGEA